MDRLLRAVFEKLVRVGNLRVTTAGRTTFACGDGAGPPVAIRFATQAAERAVLIDPELRFGELYVDGDIVIEQGSIADFLDLAIKNLSRAQTRVWSKSLRALRSLTRAIFQYNNLWRARRNAVHHYNIDYRIYRLFLDSDLQYSCAYFENGDASLDQAQLAKKRHIAGKLLLKPGLRVLDIGSGWGGLGLHLARDAKVSVVGINLSDEQVRIAQQRAAAEAAACEFRVQDYRHVSEKFDRIVSIGMFEHVGRQNYETFFRKCRDLLTDDGVMLLHTNPSCPAKAGHPVRRGLSAPLLTSLEYWIVRLRGRTLGRPGGYQCLGVALHLSRRLHAGFVGACTRHRTVGLDCQRRRSAAHPLRGHVARLAQQFSGQS